MSAPTLWIVIARPDRLHAALLAAQALRDRFPGGVRLLREDSDWWARADWTSFAKRFDSVHAFARIETCRGVRDLPRLYRQTTARLRAMRELRIDEETDVLLTLGGTLAIANAACSAYPRAFKILAVAKNTYDDLTRRVDRTRFRFTTSGWFQNRVVERCAGVNRTIHMKPRINPGGDGVRIGRLAREPADVYDSIVVSSNSGRDLPPQSSSKTIAARQPNIAEIVDLPRAIDAQPRAVFFGTPFLLIHNLKPEVYIQHLDRCLDYIRHQFGRDCVLIYRPHPAETSEADQLQLDDFIVEQDREAAELYFLKYFGSIAAVFSVSSTVSRVALNNGLNGYAFWRCFPFEQTAARFFENLMGDVPPEFDIRDLGKPPMPYANRVAPDASTRSFSDALNLAVDPHFSYAS
ncbi:MAG: hypothetical protein ACJ8JD_01610 [Chthoniobacterales bacterium]